MYILNSLVDKAKSFRKGVGFKMNKDYIVNELKQGKTVKEISNKLGLHYSTVYRYIKKHQIQIPKKELFSPTEKQDIIYLYTKELLSSVIIGKEFNVSDRTIIKLLQEEGIEIRKSGSIPSTDQHLFDIVDNEAKAYFLGLFTADGGITGLGPSGYKTATISLTESDRPLLRQLSIDLLGKDITKDGVRTNRNYNEPYLRIHGIELIQSLKRFGIKERKSLTLSSLSEEIPDELYHHYIRGLFDGDGTATHSGIYGRIGYNAGNKKMVESFRAKCVEKIQMSSNGIYQGTVYFTSWGAQEDLVKFYNYIYKDATLFLERKKNKIYKYINTEVN